ncbi:MAG: hypothetical protein WAW20_04760, partial [Anaerolineae bacterium]
LLSLPSPPDILLAAGSRRVCRRWFICWWCAVCSFPRLLLLPPPPQINSAAKLMSPDPNFDLISDPDATPAPAPVQLTLAATPQQVEPAGVVTYTVVITNTLADRDLSGLVVSDTLPLELAYWPAGEGDFSYLETERRLEWVIGQLAAGATLTAMSGGVTASYVYDGDGNRVKETISPTFGYELHELPRGQKLDSCKLVKFVAEKAGRIFATNYTN